MVFDDAYLLSHKKNKDDIFNQEEVEYVDSRYMCAQSVWWFEIFG